MVINNKIEALRKLLDQYKIDALIIPRADEHQRDDHLLY